MGRAWLPGRVHKLLEGFFMCAGAMALNSLKQAVSGAAGISWFRKPRHIVAMLCGRAILITSTALIPVTVARLFAKFAE